MKNIWLNIILTAFLLSLFQDNLGHLARGITIMEIMEALLQQVLLKMGKIHLTMIFLEGMSGLVIIIQILAFQTKVTGLQGTIRKMEMVHQTMILWEGM